MKTQIMLTVIALLITSCSVTQTNDEQELDESFFKNAVTVESSTVENSSVTIAQSEVGSYEYSEKSSKVIKDQDTFEVFWKELYAGRDTPPELPNIDFSTHTVLALLMGVQDTGGHSIEVIEIGKSGNVIGVKIEEKEPARNCSVTEMLTSPYHIVMIEKATASDFRFTTNRNVYECD